MTRHEINWLNRCKLLPDHYRIDVDNDAVFVTDTDIDECVFEFNSYGWEMVIELLRYIGCNAEGV